MLVNRSFSLWVRFPPQSLLSREKQRRSRAASSAALPEQCQASVPYPQLISFPPACHFPFEFPASNRWRPFPKPRWGEKRVGLRCPRSMALRWVLPIPAKLLTTSWEIPFFSRTWRIAAPTVSAFNIVYPLLSVSFIVSENKLHFEYIYTQRIQMWQKLGFTGVTTKLMLLRNFLFKTARVIITSTLHI